MSLIDIFPTITDLVGNKIPTQCRGKSLLTKTNDSKTKLFERPGSKYYSVAVEEGDIKVIFTYPQSNYPNPPTADDLEGAPVLEEAYEISSVRNGVYNDIRSKLSDQRVEELRSEAETFALRNQKETSDDIKKMGTSAEIEERLRNLGYRE
jgi:hypothetical protein